MLAGASLSPNLCYVNEVTTEGRRGGDYMYNQKGEGACLPQMYLC